MADYVELDLPDMLDIPDKMLPLLLDFNDYDYFLIEGGRASSKTQSAGRCVLYIGEEVDARIVCGREIMSTIEESVHAVLKDLVEHNNLDWTVKKNYLQYNGGKTRITFKGFREQGQVNIKGLEGVDILWIDEAQSVTKDTLDTIIPTIRKPNSKIIFTMNRYLRSDAVPAFFSGRKDCLHIKINYVDNKHCPLKIKNEAEIMKIKRPKDYNHIYMGVPLATADDYLFNQDFLYAAVNLALNGEDYRGRQRVMGIDFAAQGADQCVATILDRVTSQQWKVVEQIAWDEWDSMVSIGKIVTLMAEWKPDVVGLDVGGMGHVVHNRLTELNHKIQRYDGATTEGINDVDYINLRADAYYGLVDWFERGAIIIPEGNQVLIDELEKIKMTYKSDGKRGIQSKKDARKDPTAGSKSPDHADSLKIAVWCTRFIGQNARSNDNSGAKVTRRSSARSRRR